MTRILEIGANVKPLSQITYEDAEIIFLDADPNVPNIHVVADASQPLPFAEGTFDGIFASHILEHITYWKEQSVLIEWARCLKSGGMLHILVPSWEWVARQVLSEKPSPALKPLAFAGQVSPWDIHLNMFTMRQLRALLDRAGLSVVRARTGGMIIAVVGEPYEVEQHYVAAVKGVPVLEK